MAEQQGLEALSAQILGEARQRSAGLIEAAESRAATIRRAGQERARAARRSVVAEAEREAARDRSRVEAEAHLRARQRLLMKREELITRVLAAAHERLRTELPPEERRAALEKALREAATALGGGRLEVQANEQDMGFLTPEWLGELRGRLAGEGVAVEFVPGAPADIGGGAALSKDGGRAVFDASFEARLQQSQWALRSQVWQALAGAVRVVEAPPAGRG